MAFDWSTRCAYEPAHKRSFHAAALARLRKLAVELNLDAGTYDLRSNKGGIAVSGEITLHHERFYLQVSQPWGSNGHNGILLRTCHGRQDYHGGRNHFAALTMLDDIPTLATQVRVVAGLE